MYSLAPRLQTPGGDSSRLASVTDLPPTFRCEINSGGPVSDAWTISPDGPVENVVLFAQGWNTPTNTLEPLARQLVAETDGTAAVIFSQPRVALPTRLQQIPDYMRSTSLRRVEDLRARTIESVGIAACKHYGLPTLSIVAHSLGSMDAIRTAADSKQLHVTDVTALAPAGRLADKQIVPALLRAMQIATSDCGADPEPTEMPVKFGAIRGVLQPAFIQTATEAAYGLGGKLDAYAARLAARRIPAIEIDFAHDRLFGGHTRKITGFLASDVITEGLACHCAPGHTSEARRIVEKMSLMWAQVA